MKIIPFSDKFLKDSAQLFAEEYSEGRSYNWDLRTAKKYIKKSTDQFSEYCFVAVDNDKKFLGSVLCRLDPSYKGYSLYLDSLLVKKEHRHRGVGKALLHSTFKKAKQKRIRNIELIAYDHTKFPQNWYRKLGFKKTGWIQYEADVKNIKLRKTHTKHF